MGDTVICVAVSTVKSLRTNSLQVAVRVEVKLAVVAIYSDLYVFKSEQQNNISVILSNYITLFLPSLMFALSPASKISLFINTHTVEGRHYEIYIYIL